MIRLVELVLDLNTLPAAIARSIKTCLAHHRIELTNAQLDELSRSVAQCVIAVGEDIDQDLITSTQEIRR